MSVTGTWINFYTHERHWMIREVEKEVQIMTYVSGHDVFVVPVPNNLSRSSFSRERPDVLGNA